MTQTKLPTLEILDTRRELQGFFRHLAFGIGVGMALFILYGLYVSPLDPWVFRCAYLTFASMLIFLIIPASARSRGQVTFMDILWMGIALIPLLYLLADMDELYLRAGGSSATGLDVIAGCAAVLVVLETTRRSCGPALPIIALVFCLYAMFGNSLPGLLWNRGYSFERLISFLYSSVGIYTTPLGVSARYVFVFVLFGSLLQQCGAGDFFVRLARACIGWTKGGMAKVPLISSALFGCINGAAVANVVLTGSITIPAMKKVGIPAHTAAAIEATASTGGQIMPPVMGAAAFLMVDMLGVSYGTIVTAAAVPAVLYYLSIYFLIDLEADKGLMGPIDTDTPPLLRILREDGFLLVPLIAIVYTLVVQEVSPNRAALVGIISTVLISWVRKSSRISFKGFMRALSAASVGSMEIAATTAVAGIIIGVLSLTGLGVKAASIIIGYSGDSLILALLLSMFICIVLGLGLPTVAAYAMAATVIPQALVELGASELSAHMFIFFFCVLATITPPVALASFAAAAIAKADLWQVGFKALLFGFAGFVIPYMFIFDEAMLLRGTLPAIIWAIFNAVTAIWIMATAMEGWIHGLGPISLTERVLYGVAAMLCTHTGFTSSLLGMGMVMALVAWKYFSNHRQDVVRS